MPDQPRLFDQDRLAQVRSDKKAVRAQGSVLLGVNCLASNCRRCGHPCTTGHRPGKMGLCSDPHCTCLYADATCVCGCNGFEHESWGLERSSGCGRCGCARFAPTPSTTIPEKGSQ